MDMIRPSTVGGERARGRGRREPPHRSLKRLKAERDSYADPTSLPRGVVTLTPNDERMTVWTLL